MQRLWSHRDDVTLAPPFGPPTHGWQEAAASMERGASQFADGEFVSAEPVERYVTAELAHILRVERAKAKVGGGEWKVMHRHADPITGRRPAESVIQE